MKTWYKYIHFERLPIEQLRDAPSTWECRNNKTGGGLGLLGWFARWRQHIFAPDENTVYSADCLADIQHFLEQLNEGKK